MRKTLSRPRQRPGPLGAGRVSRVRMRVSVRSGGQVFGLWVRFGYCNHTTATVSLQIHLNSKDNELPTRLEVKAKAEDCS